MEATNDAWGGTCASSTQRVYLRGMTLSDFVREYGLDHAARLFGVKPRTIESYIRGERRPRPDNALAFCERTKGQVSFSELYGQSRQVS